MMKILNHSDLSSAIIQTQNLTIGISPEKPVFENISFSACNMELIALIGPNGIGKSTLLKTCMGFLHPLAGNILLHNKPVNHYNQSEIANLMSFVSSKILYNIHQRVYDFVALGRTPFLKWTGRLNATDKELIEEALSLTDLLSFQHRYMDELSDGERQRVAIARALAQNTQLILMDEPTAYLDIGNKITLVDLLHHLCKTKHKTIIFSTHDLQTTLSHSDKIWLMSGVGASEAAPEDMMLHDRFRTLYQNLKSNFNFQTGRYEFDNKQKGYFSVFAQPEVFEWVSRALARNGFDSVLVKNKSDAQIYYEISDSVYQWHFLTVDSEIVFQSIYDLIQHINYSKTWKHLSEKL